VFDLRPELRERFPLIELADLPTPIQPAGQAGAALGCDDLLIKRDDLSAADYGGNKIRKLEFLLGDALAQRRSHVVTFGGLGSNHCLATALNCRKLGLACTAVLTTEPVTAAVRRTLARHLELGTRIRLAEGYGDVRRQADAAIAAAGAGQTYEIPFGGSSAVGALGYVNAGLELAAQVRDDPAVEPDMIYMACGTAGSAAGLAIGLELAGLRTGVAALQVTPESMRLDAVAQRLLGELAGWFEPEPQRGTRLAEAAWGRIRLRTEQLGDGYAAPTAAGREALQLWQQATGLPASLTYTAKALAGLVADARAGLLKNRTVMFVNTYDSHPWEPVTEPDWSHLPTALQRLLA
jgi:D-cysteine desulfhydrase